MNAINKNHWRSLKKFVADALKKAESHHINEEEQIRLRILLGLMNATDDRQKEYDHSLFEGDGMNETFSIAVNQIFEGYTAPLYDYSIAHTRFKEERPYICGLALDFGKEGLRYEGNKGLFDVLYCSPAAVFAVVVSLVGDVLWRRFSASVERLPRYLQELYQQAYDSARAAYEESNGKMENVFHFEEECAVNKVPEISLADYNTILLHAEKISNGQHDFAPVLRRELHDKLNIGDAESLIADLMTNKDIEFLNRVWQFLSRFSFVVVGEDGAHYQLVERGNFFELDLVGQSTESFVDDTLAREPEDGIVETQLVVEKVTLEARAERIRQLQADVQRGIIQIGFELIAAKKEVGHGGWADWLQKEFEWTQQTANRFMRVAERFGKLNVGVQFRSSTLQEMLALPEGDETAFIEAQVAAGKPVENQSKREVRESVKQWKEARSKEVSAKVANEFNLFADEFELADQSQSVGEREEDIVIESDSALIRNAELTSTPTEESVDEVAPAESMQSFTDEANRGVALEKKRAETQKLLDEISMLIQTAADTKLDETIRELKSIRDVLNASC